MDYETEETASQDWFVAMAPTTHSKGRKRLQREIGPPWFGSDDVTVMRPGGVVIQRWLMQL